MIRYSVLMSVYQKDDPAFLKLSLESIYDRQTRKPDEIIVIFDGPLSDELLSVLNAFADGKSDIVKYYPQPVNQGLGEALRIGTEKCTGDYIFRMDADDISVCNRFEKQIRYIEDHPEIDVLGTDIAEFQFSVEEKKRICSYPSSHDEIVKFAKRRNPINHVSVCVKKSALIRCGGYQPLRYLEDYYLWLRMIINGCRFANLNEPLVNVRTGNGFYARRGSKEQINGWKVLQKLMLQNHMINRFQMMKNMVIVRGFVYTPPKLKEWIYTTFMRK